MKYIVKTEGMGCAHCIKRVTDSMNALCAKIDSIELNDISVEFSGDAAELREAIEDLGFDVISIVQA